MAAVMHTEETRQATSALPQERWTTCCSRTEASFVRYVAQILVSLIVLVFALIMIGLGHSDPYYFSLVTLVIGLFLPEPKHRPMRPVE